MVKAGCGNDHDSTSSNDGSAVIPRSRTLCTLCGQSRGRDRRGRSRRRCPVARAIAADGRRLAVEPRIHHRLENQLVVHVEELRERRNCSRLEAKARVKNALSSPQRSCKCMQYKGNAESLLVSLPHCACQQHAERTNVGLSKVNQNRRSIRLTPCPQRREAGSKASRARASAGRRT
jgi:hypothetical protein